MNNLNRAVEMRFGYDSDGDGLVGGRDEDVLVGGGGVKVEEVGETTQNG